MEAKFNSHRPFWTLLKKEILRFLAVGSQTLAAPIVSAGLYLLIFGLSLGQKISILPGFTYLQFIVPGLVLMGVVNNSFANVSSSLFMSRYLGSIVELLVTPLTAGQFILAYTLAAMIRGILVGAVIFGVASIFTALPWAHPSEALLMIILASFMFSQFGIIAAILSTSFDTLSMFTNFLIMPLIYLGGLFYPIAMLPEPWRTVSTFNPLYYLIEGFRTALLGHNGINLWLAMGVGTAISVCLFGFAAHLMRIGYKIRN